MRTRILCRLAALTAFAAFGHATTFQDDVAFLKRHTGVVVLKDRSAQAQVAVVPAYQGRIMTSTARGSSGRSYGWVNRELIASEKFEPHINVFGGEDRFWLGPEGGQFSIFFAPDVPFDLEHWFTPAPIDTEPFKLERSSDTQAMFVRSMALTNYSGTRLELEVQRVVRLIEPKPTLAMLGVALSSSVAAVGVESVNMVRNTGTEPWTKRTGLLSIWILGMYNASDQSTVVIPFLPGPQSALGPVVNDTYFGKVPSDRLVVRDGVMFFRGDADYRSKIGVPPRRARPIIGSYDAANRILTLVQYTLPPSADGYVNSMWELQDSPFAGDVINSYNDGPSSPGGEQMGRFYELESSSPALALAPGESAVHVHRTLHMEGTESELDAIARQCLGVSLQDIKSAFAK